MTARAFAALWRSCSLPAAAPSGGLYDRWFGSSTPAVKPAPLPPRAGDGAGARSRGRRTSDPPNAPCFSRRSAATWSMRPAPRGGSSSFDARTGKQVAAFTAGQPLSAGVGASGTLVLVGTVKGEVLAFDTSGKQIWKAQLSGEVLAPPAVEGGLVVARAGDGRIYGFDATNGNRLLGLSAHHTRALVTHPQRTRSRSRRRVRRFRGGAPRCACRCHGDGRLGQRGRVAAGDDRARAGRGRDRLALRRRRSGVCGCVSGPRRVLRRAERNDDLGARPVERCGAGRGPPQRLHHRRQECRSSRWTKRRARACGGRRSSPAAA